jgi:hypothetical protein
MLSKRRRRDLDTLTITQNICILQYEVIKTALPNDLPPEILEDLRDSEHYEIRSDRTHISHGVIEKGQYRPVITHLAHSHPAMGPQTKYID